MNSNTKEIGKIGLYEDDSDAIENAIEVDNLTVYYQRVCALSNVSLRVKDGNSWALSVPTGEVKVPS